MDHFNLLQGGCQAKWWHDIWYNYKSSGALDLPVGQVGFLNFWFYTRTDREFVCTGKMMPLI